MYGQFPISSPPRAYIRRGYLTEGILRYEFVGGDYFWNFTVTCYISFRVLSRTEASVTFTSLQTQHYSFFTREPFYFKWFSTAF